MISMTPLLLTLAVLCEKPFTPTAKEAHELVTLAQKHKRVLSIFQSMSRSLFYNRRG